tara:strand:- start:46 stop:255 length:210 start_codon:yes stop_codon:yes gene_type:complete
MAEASKTPKKRTSRPLYAVMSITGEDGKVLPVTKENVTIHSVHKDSDELLDMLDSGSMPAGTFYKRIAL